MATIMDSATSAVTSLGMTSWIVVLLVVVILVYLLVTSRSGRNRKDNKHKLPPSPGFKLPVLGHLHLIRTGDPLEQFSKLREKLGDIFMLRMGPKVKMVVVNGHEALKEVFVKHADVFSDRPRAVLRDVGFPDMNKGIVQSSGANWKEQRTTALSIMRQFGMGSNFLAEKIAEEVSSFTQQLKLHDGRPINIRPITNMSVSNVISAIIFGKRFELDDPMFTTLIETIHEQLRMAAGTSIFRFLPKLMHLPGDFLGIKTVLKRTRESFDFTDKFVEEKTKEFDPETMTSFVDAYNREMERKHKQGVKTHLDKRNLMRIINQLFIAGTETTSSVILWCVVCVLNNPSVQDKIYTEICQHVGKDRVPTMQDKPNLKYLQAVISETLRLGNVAPLSLPHIANQDIVINNHTIPKDAMVIPNLYSANMDAKVWGDPHNFRPERFIDNHGNLLNKREELIPFSLGRRMCLGESLARMELFLFLSAAFQKFEFHPTDPKSVPEMRGVFGLNRPPVEFKVRCVDRNGGPRRGSVDYVINLATV